MFPDLTEYSIQQDMETLEVVDGKIYETEKPSLLSETISQSTLAQFSSSTDFYAQHSNMRLGDSRASNCCRKNCCKILV
jgi:hypothetical protein